MDEKTLMKELKTVIGTGLSVTDPATFDQAGQAVITLKEMRKRVIEYWRPVKEKAFQAHKEILSKENEMLGPIDSRIKGITADINEYLTEQKRIQQEAQRRADMEREAQERAERERLERAAAKAEEKGKAEKADELREQAATVYIPPVEVAAQVEKTTRTDAGTVSAKDDIEIKITDMKALLGEIIAGGLPVDLVAVNMIKLKQITKAMGWSTVAGCEIRKIVTSQFRGKK